MHTPSPSKHSEKTKASKILLKKYGMKPITNTLLKLRENINFFLYNT
jgi:hypothetical protein